MKRAKSASEPVVLSPCQIVAWNLENLRRDKHWSQTEAAKRLKPYLGYEMSREAWSKMERSLKGVQIRRFDADEIVAFARVFDKPVAYFFCVPKSQSQYGYRPVVVNGKPGQPNASVKSKPLSEREMTALSAQAWLPGVDGNTLELLRQLWLLLGESYISALDESVEEDPERIDKVRGGSRKAMDELSERVRQRIFAPSTEANIVSGLLEAFTRRSTR
jgi:hypothetical protein